MFSARVFFVVISITSLITGCEEEENEFVLFTRLSKSSTNIDFKNMNVEDEKYNVFTYEYFYNGGGVAVGDINNDGLVDIYFSSNQEECKLYLNKGNFEFEDITERSGTAAKRGWKTGVAMVDINADGLLDIYVCRSFEENPFWRENSLFINKGDLTFEDKAKEYGLNDNSYSTHALFFDYDRDGDLDMFLLNHSVSHIVRNYDIRYEIKTENIEYVGNKLFENKDGKFIDVSPSRGIYGPAHNYGLGIACSDVNNDGWLDLYASNDYTGSDYLLVNKDGKFFQNASDSLLTQLSKFSMGVDISDINNDGYTDIFTLDMLPDNNYRQKELQWPEQYDIYAEMVRNGLHHQYMRNMLHLNNGMGSFSEVGQLAGISNTDWSWAALFADYDNDGWQDLFVSNGYKRDYTNNDFLKYRADQMIAKRQGAATESYAKMIEKIPSNKTHNYLFKNQNGLQFSEVSDSWGLGDAVLTHGAAYADLDNDGDLDLILNNMDEVAGIYRNNSEKLLKNNFLKIRLEGTDDNRFGIGAKVTIYCNGKLMMRELCPYRGFQSSVEPILHFGLRSNSKVDSLVVDWPRGEHHVLSNISINQTITLHQKEATFQEEISDKRYSTYFSLAPAINFIHKENDFIDFKIQPLLQRMYSTDGPALANGDVNGDGRIDLYFGGAKNQEGQLFIKNKNGTYTKKAIPDLTMDATSEDIDAIFFDMDGDKDLDLYVVSGGYEFSQNDPMLQDRIYRNDGKGNFMKVSLPQFFSSGSCVRQCDIDEDGDADLFIGGRIIPGRYPEIPESYILLNDGKGNFSIATDIIGPGLKHIGLVTDAAWVDVNNDEVKDLIVVGEWMGVQIFENQKGSLKENTSQYIKENTNGFWNCILAHDFDKDGDLDLVIGNRGINNQIKPSDERPATLYYADFDNNGSVDPLLCYYVKDNSYPFPTRDELTEHLPYLRKRFKSYSSYTNATIDSILTQEQMANASKFQAYYFETSYFQNEGGSFIRKPLPIQAQFAPVFAFATMDVNGDGHDDLITGGNLLQTKARTGMLKGNHVFVFLGNGKGDFSFVEPFKSGINLPEDVRHIVVDRDRIILAINNAPTKSYILRDKLKVFSDESVHVKNR